MLRWSDSGILTGANSTPLYQAASFKSVFNRINWPRDRHRGTVHPPSFRSFPRGNHRTKFSCPSGVSNFQKQKEVAPRWGPGTRSTSQSALWACRVCSWDGIIYCRSWASCRSCQRKGHILAHCTGQWKKTRRKVQSHETKFANVIDSNEESCSKTPFNLLMIDILSVSSTSPLDTSPHIGVHPPNPASKVALELSRLWWAVKKVCEDSLRLQKERSKS
jgi:hypothetical protein